VIARRGDAAAQNRAVFQQQHPLLWLNPERRLIGLADGGRREKGRGAEKRAMGAQHGRGTLEKCALWVKADRVAPPPNGVRNGFAMLAAGGQAKSPFVTTGTFRAKGATHGAAALSTQPVAPP